MFAGQQRHAGCGFSVTIWNKRGNTVGRVTINGLRATGVYRSAMSLESWADAPLTNVVLRDVQVEYTGGGKAWPPGQNVNGPGVDARPLPAWGLYARNVQTLTLEDVRFSLASDDSRPVVSADRVERRLSTASSSRACRGVRPIITTNVGNLLKNP